MKIINKEYGFTGRPPFFDEFYEEFSGAGPQLYKETPIKPRVGMGLDLKAPTGLALIGKNGAAWGVRVSYFKLGREMAPIDFVKNLPDYFTENFSKKYSYFSGGDITCKILEYAGGEAVLMLSALDRARVRLQFYSLNDEKACFEFSEGELLGSSAPCFTVKGEMEFNEKFTEIKGRYFVEDDAKARNILYMKAYSSPDIVEDEIGRFNLEYALDEKNSRALFYVKLGEKGENVPDEEELLRGISSVELEFSAEKLTGSGALAGGLEQATNALMYNRIYDPYLNTLLYAGSREKTDYHYAHRGDSLCLSSMFSVLHGNLDDAFSQSLLACTDKMLGAFSAWFVFSRTRNREFLKNVFERLTGFWAPDGELSVAQNGGSGYRMFGTVYKETDAPVYAFDMSCYKLLAYDIIARMGEVLKDKKKAGEYRAAHEKLKREINLKLYNEELKIYEDRYVKGGFTEVFSALSFLAFLSGAADSAEKCEALILHLTDKNEFWSAEGVVFLPKNSPYFKSRISPGAEGWENRAVYPVLNYLIYLGLRRYGIDGTASELALKEVKSREKYFNRFRAVPDVFFKGIDHEKRPKLSLEGSLPAHIGMFEILDVEYFNSDLRPSISFGTLAKGADHGVSNARLFNKRISINVQAKLTRLYIDGKLMFEGEGGRFEIRNFAENADGAEFLIDSDAPVLISLYLPFFTAVKETALIKLTAPEGKSRIKIVKGKAVIDKFNS